MILLRFTRGAFIQNYQCSGIDMYNYNFETFVVDVALDEEEKKLKFFMNTKVIDFDNPNDRGVIVTDVNSTTNRYTTFHVEIQFMGNVFINENKRFCDMIAVKNTTEFLKSPRFTDEGDDDDGNSETGDASTAQAATATADANAASDLETVSDDKDHGRHPNIGNGTSVNAKRDFLGNSSYVSMAHSNSSIETIFSNKTGELVQCPLYINDSIILYYEADISEHFHRLGSYAARFSIVSNDLNSDVIGCNKAYITPVQSDYISASLFIGVLLLLLITALINFLTVIYSSYQESSNPFLFTASTICNRNLLKQLDATVQRIIIYLQFALFMAGLDLDYPGFYQPLIGQIRWCALLGISLLGRSSDYTHKSSDNIYVTLNGGGLKSLALYSTDRSIHDGWPNFMLCLLAWTVFSITAQQVFLITKSIIDFVIKKFNRNKKSLLNDEKSPGSNFNFTFTKNLYYILGSILSSFLSVFGFPFLILTSYLFDTASYFNNNHILDGDMNDLSRAAFDCSVDYDDLFKPRNSGATKTFSDTVSTMTVSSATSSFGTSIPSSGEIVGSGNLTVYPNGTITKLTHTTIDSKAYLGVPIPSIIISSICFTLYISLVLYFTFKYLITIKDYKIRGSKKVSRLYTSMKVILVWGFSYHHYHPNKVHYVIYDYISLIIKSLVIGLLQSKGIVQVSILILVEFFDLVFLFAVQPYYLELTWTTTRWILPTARLFVTALCIPFIKELGLAESTKTYVAYVQLLIHLVIALVFIIQLACCSISTVISIIKVRREKKQYATYSTDDHANSIDDFNKEFEYQPMKNQIGPLLKPDASKFLHVDTAYDSLMFGIDNSNVSDYDPNKSNNSTIKYDNSSPVEFKNGGVNLNDNDIKLENDNDYYYRGQKGAALLDKKNDFMKRDLSGKTLKNLESPSKSPVALYDSSPKEVSSDVESDNLSFHHQQQRSNIRKRENDYTVREADKIYRKYFVDASIDPEIKALWDSRNKWSDTLVDVDQDDERQNNSHNTSKPYKQQAPVSPISETLSSTTLFTKLKNTFNSLSNTTVSGKPVETKGFQVSRPRPLIVKPLSQLQVPKNEEDSFEDSDYSFVNLPDDYTALKQLPCVSESSESSETAGNSPKRHNP